VGWFKAQPLGFQAGVVALTLVSAWFALFGTPALWAMAVPGTPIPLGMRMMGIAFVLMTSPALYLALFVQARAGGAGLRITGAALAMAWLLFSALTYFLSSLAPEAAWNPTFGVPALAGAALLLVVWRAPS
jgi:hypothetical protein